MNGGHQVTDSLGTFAATASAASVSGGYSHFSHASYSTRHPSSSDATSSYTTTHRLPASGVSAYQGGAQLPAAQTYAAQQANQYCYPTLTHSAANTMWVEWARWQRQQQNYALLATSNRPAGDGNGCVYAAPWTDPTKPNHSQWSVLPADSSCSTVTPTQSSQDHSFPFL